MKYIFKAVFSLFLAIPLTLSTVSCLGNDKDNDDVHEHVWGEPTALEDASCESEGRNEYICSICSEAKYETTSPLGHSWNFESAVWSWSGTNSAEVTLECTNAPSHAESFDAEVLSQVTKKPTYSETGTKTYTASVTLDDRTLTDAKAQTIPARQLPVIDDNKFVDYSTFRAEYYAKEYQKNKTSYGYEYLKLLENEPAFMNSVLVWESMHLMVDPTYEAGEIKRKDLYSLIIYDILTGESGNLEMPLHLIDTEATSYMSSVANLIFGDSLTTEGAMNAMRVIEPAQYNDLVTASNLFKNVDIVANIFDLANDLCEAVEMCSYYQALSNMNDSFIELLAAISYDTRNDPALREAASDVINAVNAAQNDLLEYILLKEWGANSAVTLIKIGFDNIWGNLTKICCPHLLVAGIAAKGGMILADKLYDLDANIQAYYKLKVAVEFEYALRRQINDNVHNIDYGLKEHQDICMYTVEALGKSIALGYDYSIELLEETLDTPLLSSKDKEFILEYIAEIKALKIRSQEIDGTFEHSCISLYEEYLELDLHNYSPVDTVMVSLVTGKYKGSYTAPQGIQGVKINILEKRELLNNDELLKEYARIACEYEAKTPDGGSIISAEDIEYMLEPNVHDFVVIIEFYPTVENPDVECGLYIADVSYDHANGYNIEAREWIQHNSYLLADFMYVQFIGAISGKVYGQTGDALFGSYVEVGDLTLECDAS